MSTYSFARVPRGVLGAWETKGQIRFARFDDARTIRSVPGETGKRKHPSIAANTAGEVLVAWTEGMGWNTGGELAWQLFDAEGRPIAGQSGRRGAVPVWSLVQAVALADGSFVILH